MKIEFPKEKVQSNQFKAAHPLTEARLKMDHASRAEMMQTLLWQKNPFNLSKMFFKLQQATYQT